MDRLGSGQVGELGNGFRFDRWVKYESRGFDLLDGSFGILSVSKTLSFSVH